MRANKCAHGRGALVKLENGRVHTTKLKWSNNSISYGFPYVHSVVKLKKNLGDLRQEKGWNKSCLLDRNKSLELFNSRALLMDYNFTTRDLPDKWFSVSIFYTWKWMVLAIYCFLCVKKVLFYKFFWLLHKLSPNWPRAGNSSGSISYQALLAAWIYSLFGKVKVIYKHYQKPFPMHTMTKTSLRNKFHLGGRQFA